MDNNFLFDSTSNVWFFFFQLLIAPQNEICFHWISHNFHQSHQSLCEVSYAGLPCNFHAFVNGCTVRWKHCVRFRSASVSLLIYYLWKSYRKIQDNHVSSSLLYNNNSNKIIPKLSWFRFNLFPIVLNCVRRSFTRVTMNVEWCHWSACTLSASHVVAVFLCQRPPNHLAAIVHVRVNVWYHVGTSKIGASRSEINIFHALWFDDYYYYYSIHSVLTTFCRNKSNLSHFSRVTSCLRPSICIPASGGTIIPPDATTPSKHNEHAFVVASADDIDSKPVSLSTYVAPPSNGRKTLGYKWKSC